jgi:hypothetical protein
MTLQEDVNEFAKAWEALVMSIAKLTRADRLVKWLARVLPILLLCTAAHAQELVPDAASGIYKCQVQGSYARAYLEEMYVVFDGDKATGHFSHMVKGIAPVRIDYRLAYSDTLLVFSHFRLTGSTPAVMNLEDLKEKYRKTWLEVIERKILEMTKAN